MTRVDFYVLPESGERARAQFACRLAEKACGLGHRVWVRTDSDAEARALDDLMWTFHDQAFVPHALAGEADEPVQIGSDALPDEGRDLLINLGSSVPEWVGRFARVAEVVDDEPARKAAGRERFRHYRDRGYPHTTHKL